jgi:hypothetical protein
MDAARGRVASVFNFATDRNFHRCLPTASDKQRLPAVIGMGALITSPIAKGSAASGFSAISAPAASWPFGFSHSLRRHRYGRRTSAAAIGGNKHAGDPLTIGFVAVIRIGA